MMIHPLSLASFASCITLLYFSVTVLRSNYRAYLNRAFSAMTFSWALIAFAYTFMYSARSWETLVFWKNVSSFGWFLIPGVTVHATFFLVKKSDTGRRWWIYPLMYLPACVFLAHELSGKSMVLGHVVRSFGGQGVTTGSPHWFIAFVVYGFTYFSASLGMVLRWMLATTIEKEKWQSRMILALGVTVLAVGSVTDGALPLLNINLIPPLAPVLIVLWLAALWIAIIRFDLFDLASAMVSTKLLESYDFYQTLMNNFTDIIWTMDRNLRLVFVSASAKNFLGYEPEEMMKLTLDRYITPESYAFTVEKMAGELARDGEPGQDPNRTVRADIQYVRKDGTRFWAEVHVKFIREGGVITGLLGISRDVSDRKNAEESLRTSQEKYRQLVEHAGDVIYQTDRHGIFTYVNPTVERISGWSWKDMVGNNFIEFVPPEYRDQMNRFYAEQYVSCAPRTYMEMPLIAKDGVVRLFGQNVQLLVENGRIVGFHGVARDVTDRKHFEDQLRQRNEIIERDLTNAQFIQQALLPAAPPRWDHLNIDFRFMPMEKIGGDFFSFTPLQEGGLGVFIGDVSGHGVSAALFLSLLKAETDHVCRTRGFSPRDYIAELNRDLITSMPGHFVTAIYGLFTRNSRTGGLDFTFANGGHPGPILYRRGAAAPELIAGHGTVLGKFRDMPVTDTTVSLEIGDRIFLYTDGIPESRARGGQYLGFDAISGIIREANRSDLGSTLDAIIERCDGFRGGLPQEDDIVLIGFEVAGAGSGERQ